jgi:hypothetical protein
VINEIDFVVCRSCNARANFDRYWHIHWYQAIINKRYGEYKNEL